jgi:[acyl-carrier-protein] S-malonyltransferase
MARTAFVFPGQGAQTVGMAAGVCGKLPAAKALFDQAADILGYDLLAVCTAGPAEKLNATDVSQPALYVAGLAALELVKAEQPDLPATCVATAGLSLGEYTALTFAGALPFADGLKVVRERGRAMQAAAVATPSGMASVIGPDVAAVEAVCAAARAETGSVIRVANLLCPGNTVISGTLAGLDAAEKLADAQGFRVVRLAVAGAFHTELMKPADERLAEALAGATLAAPRIPVWSNVDARPHQDPAELGPLLVRQILSPVRMEESLRGMIAAGVEQFHELGPGKVIAGLLKRIDRKMPCVNITV